MPNIRCNYGKPKYAIGDRVLHNGKTYIVIGFEINFDSFKMSDRLSFAMRMRWGWMHKESS